jgi:mono/diheme cytochrome c family protein
MRVASQIGVRACLLLGLLTWASVAGAGDAGQIERGRYLAHEVAMCVQCHTPRAADGTLLRGQEFMGGTFPVAPPVFMPEDQWCLVTPRIAGLPGFTDEEGIKFFMNGARLGKHQPKWPMPPFHMNHDDAAAIVAYLKSLGSATLGIDQPAPVPQPTAPNGEAPR